MISVDIRAPRISPERRVWRLFPGNGYKFLPDFEEQGVAFLDFPGLELPQAPISKSSELLPRIISSQMAGDQIRRLGPDAPINLNWEQFKGARVTKSRGRLRQAAINFFEIAERGDLIVVPTTLQIGKVWIGQIESEQGQNVPATYIRRYGELLIPSKKVTWLTKIDEHKVSPFLSSSLRQQHPFSLLEKGLFNEIFSIAHSNYIFGERYSSVVFNRKDDYLDQDAALISLITRLCSYACCVVEGEDGFADRNILKLFLNPPPIEYSCAQASDIHSPGFNRFTGAKPTALVIAAVIGALTALSAFSSEESIEADVAHIAFVNSAAKPDDECTAKVSEASKFVLNSMGIEDVWKLCTAMKLAQERAGIEANVVISNRENVVPEGKHPKVDQLGPKKVQRNK